VWSGKCGVGSGKWKVWSGKWSSELRIKFDCALLALGRLDSVSSLLPDTSHFLYMYIRKEAVLSSMKLSSENSVRINSLKPISGSIHMIHRSMLERPMASPNWLQQKTELSHAIVNTCLRELENIGILEERHKSVN
jgi:hypothetical protein